MRTAENRARYDRSRLRCPSDLTDEEWAHVAPLIPRAKHGANGRERSDEWHDVLAQHRLSDLLWTISTIY
jgi:transposase